MTTKRATTTKAKALTLADVRQACREALDEYFHAGEVARAPEAQMQAVETVANERIVMTAPPPQSNFTAPTVKPGYLANMMRAR